MQNRSIIELVELQNNRDKAQNVPLNSVQHLLLYIYKGRYQGRTSNFLLFLQKNRRSHFRITTQIELKMFVYAGENMEL